MKVRAVSINGYVYDLTGSAATIRVGKKAIKVCVHAAIQPALDAYSVTHPAVGVRLGYGPTKRHAVQHAERVLRGLGYATHCRLIRMYKEKILRGKPLAKVERASAAGYHAYQKSKLCKDAKAKLIAAGVILG